MDDRILDCVFSGSLKGLPPLKSKIVRIFTSSTFTDMSLERNTLMENVYPKIKEYCKERHGLEFQVVDMRWGVRDEATDDHMTTDLCMKEIENCQRLSIGPNFVAFLGQKYGYRPIPTFIEGLEFRLLVNTLNQMDISEAEQLDLWYKEDVNSIPSVYVLQPISSILTNFTNRSEPELQTKDQNIWWQTLHRLQILLRMAANRLFECQTISANVKHNYMMSVTEREITNGILNVVNVKRHCLAYFRQINRIDTTNIGVVDKFIDMTAKGHIDKEAQTLLNHLRDNRLISTLSSPNLAKFTVDWSPNQGLNSSDHSEYLQDFGQHFYTNITRLVRKAMRKEDQTPLATLTTEILYHSHSCNSNVEVFEGRVKQLKAIENYIKSHSNRPLVIHGCDGCGKTCLLAKAATLLDVWTEKDCKYILCLRFIGTTPDSSSVIPLLTSICQQISYNFLLPFDELPDDLIGLTFYFKQLLLKTDEQLVFIFIDSIDQLSENMESTMKLSFLIQNFPQNVKIVISCSSVNGSKDFEFLNKMIEQRDQLIEVEPLGPELAIKVIKRWLDSAKRDITVKQWQTVEEVIKHCSLPIFARLVFAEIIQWKSYSKPNQTLLSNTVMDSIFLLFDRIQVQHGKTLVSHALSYITASKVLTFEYSLEVLRDHSYKPMERTCF